MMLRLKASDGSLDKVRLENLLRNASLRDSKKIANRENSPAEGTELQRLDCFFRLETPLQISDKLQARPFAQQSDFPADRNHPTAQGAFVGWAAAISWCEGHQALNLRIKF